MAAIIISVPAAPFCSTNSVNCPAQSEVVPAWNVPAISRRPRPHHSPSPSIPGEQIDPRKLVRQVTSELCLKGCAGVLRLEKRWRRSDCSTGGQEGEGSSKEEDDEQ